jgi:hypothetical protein
MGWPPLERVGAYTGVAWVSFRAFDERGVAGLPAAVAGLCCGSVAAAVRRVSRTTGLCAGAYPPLSCLVGVVATRLVGSAVALASQCV